MCRAQRFRAHDQPQGVRDCAADLKLIKAEFAKLVRDGGSSGRASGTRAAGERGSGAGTGGRGQGSAGRGRAAGVAAAVPVDAAAEARARQAREQLRLAATNAARDERLARRAAQQGQG